MNLVFPLRAALPLLIVGLAAASASAELIVGLTTDDRITTFDSASPGSATAPVAVSGLAAGESLIGIDRRPKGGRLYGVTTAGNIYTINPITGATSFKAALSTSLSGTDFGIDFNPVVDRLRIVSDANQNLRVNVATGIALTDAPLVYKASAPADANAGTDPNIVAAAYTNNRDGVKSTSLRVLDSALDIVATQAPPNDGVLNTQLGLGVDFSGIAGYDISGLTGTPYAAFLLEGDTFSGFYTLGPGGATLVDEVSTLSGVALALRDIAAPVGVPEPTTFALLGLTGAVVAFRRRRMLRVKS